MDICLSNISSSLSSSFTDSSCIFVCANCKASCALRTSSIEVLPNLMRLVSWYATPIIKISNATAMMPIQSVRLRSISWFVWTLLFVLLISPLIFFRSAAWVLANCLHAFCKLSITFVSLVFALLSNWILCSPSLCLSTSLFKWFSTLPCLFCKRVNLSSKTLILSASFANFALISWQLMVASRIIINVFFIIIHTYVL